MHLLFDGVSTSLQRDDGQRMQQRHDHQQQRLQQGPELSFSAPVSLAGTSALAGEARHAASPQQAPAAAPGHQEEDGHSVRSEAARSAGASSDACGASWQSAEEQARQFGQQDEEQISPRSGGSGSDYGSSAAFQFSPHGQRGQQQQEGQQALQQGSSAADSAAPGQWQHQQQLQQATGAGFAGFGSPIRVQPSPAKPAAGGGLPSRLRFAAPEESSCEQAGEQARSWLAGSRHRQDLALLPQDEQQHAGRAAAQAASVGDPGRPAADAGQITPAVHGSAWASRQGAPPTGLDPYLTARSVAAPASCAGSVGGDAFDSPRSPAAGSEGGGSSSGGASSGGGGLFGGPVPLGKGSLGQASAAGSLALPPAGAAGRKDLDSIVGSIRRLAAEMR